MEAKNIFEELQELHIQVGRPKELHHLMTLVNRRNQLEAKNIFEEL